MNKHLFVATTLVALAFSPSLVRAHTAAQNSEPFRRTITVTGYGQASAVPNVARIVVGVEAINPKLSPALIEVNRKMAAVIAALEKAGVAKRDIRTLEFSVVPERTHNQSGPGPISNYRVSNVVRITVRNIEKSGEILDAALSAGANVVQALSFEVENMKQVEAEARKAAIADAKAKAESLVSAAGAKLGRILTISEFSVGVPPMPMMAFAAADKAAPEGTAIAPGSQEIVIQIQATFEIE
jgi:uncharacterized protein YggE